MSETTSSSPTTPVSDRPARPTGAVGVGHAVILIAAACMPILGSTSIAPLQPSMIAAFPDQPGASVLVPMILTVPALIIGLTAFGIGRVIDAIGRKRVLVVALFMYALFGTMPLYLPSLPLILGSRVFVGVAEAAIFSSVITIFADSFFGAKRARYYATQNATTALAAVVFIAVSGILGAANWRTPFWIYAIAVVLALLAWAFLPVTARVGSRPEKLPPVNWERLAKPVVITFVGGIVFYVPVGLLSLKLAAIGIVATSEIGAVSAIAALALAVSAGLTPAFLKRIPNVMLVLAFVLLGVGLLVIGFGESVVLVTVGAVIANFGGGIIATGLQHWALQSMPFDQRGRASGWWTSAFFVGQFIGPVVIGGLSPSVGLSGPIIVVGVIGLVMAVVCALTARPRLEEQPA